MKTQIDVQINAFSLEDLRCLTKVNVEEALAVQIYHITCK